MSETGVPNGKRDWPISRALFYGAILAASERLEDVKRDSRDYPESARMVAADLQAAARYLNEASLHILTAAAEESRRSASDAARIQTTGNCELKAGL